MIGADGRFVRGPIGSAWWLAHERLTLLGVAAWRVRSRRSKDARVHAALAVFAGDDPAQRRLIRWTSVRSPRGTLLPPLRYVDLLEPTPAPWLGAVHSAVAADEAADWRAGDEAIAADPWGHRWMSDVESVVRLERCEGEAPFDPAAVTTLVELDAESPEEAATPDLVWLLGDAHDQALAAYSLTPYKPEPYDPSVSTERLLLHHLALSAVAIVLGAIALLVTDAL